VRRAAGAPSLWRSKLGRLRRILDGYVDRRELDERLARLAARGVIEEIPSRLQLAVGAYDMLRFWINPAAEDYYRQQGIGYGFHQFLRFLDEPASLTDPVGFFSERDGIIGHLMQVVHANPVYDLQLLMMFEDGLDEPASLTDPVGFFSERDGIIGHLMQVVHANPVYDLQLLMMFEDGLDELEAQLEAMLTGTHPRAASIGAIVEEPDYHGNLLSFVRAWRRDPTTPPLLRSNIAGGYPEVERVFGTLTGSMRYFTRMPRTLRGAVEHVVTVRHFRA
jgi:hypothetical protein